MSTKYPFGDAQVVESTGDSGALSASIDNQKTILKYSGLAGAVTALNLDIADGVQPGAELFIEVTQGATGRDFAVNGSTGFDSNVPDLTGVANDVDVNEFIYDGSAFVAKSTWQKVVDAA